VVVAIVVHDYIYPGVQILAPMKGLHKAVLAAGTTRFRAFLYSMILAVDHMFLDQLRLIQVVNAKRK